VGLVTDAAVLSTMADGVILVCVAGKTKRETLRKSIGTLSRVNANLIGIVMNMIGLKSRSYYTAY
jgi:Mrp family chromosome partitioning ATPase